MSSFGVSSLSGMPLVDRLPEGAKIVGNQIPVQSVITKRKQIIAHPNNGDTFNPNQQIIITMSSPTDFLIPSSASIHYKLTNLSTTNADLSSTTACFDEGYSVWNRCQFKTSGSMLEDVLDCNKTIDTLTRAHMNQTHYNHEGSLNYGNWKWVNGYRSNTLGDVDFSGTYDETLEDDLAQIVNTLRHDSFGVAERQAIRADFESNSGAATKNEIEVNLPLSFFFATFRSNKLFPLAYTTECRLELLLESAVKAMYSSVSTDNLNYQISDVYVVCDAVELSSSYMQVLSAAFNSSEELGYSLPIPTIRTSLQNITGGGQQVATFSMSTPFLKSIYFRLANSADDSTVDAYSISGGAYRLNADPNLSLRIGTNRYPEYDNLRSALEIYRNNNINLGHNGNVADSLGLSTENTFANVNDDGSTFYLLFNFEKVNGLPAEYYSLESIDISISGGVINLDANYTASTQLLAMFEYVRVLQFASRRVDVKG